MVDNVDILITFFQLIIGWIIKQQSFTYKILGIEKRFIFTTLEVLLQGSKPLQCYWTFFQRILGCAVTSLLRDANYNCFNLNCDWNLIFPSCVATMLGILHVNFGTSEIQGCSVTLIFCLKICVTNYLDSGILQAYCYTGFIGNDAKSADSNQCTSLSPVN